ncbi:MULTISPECIES: hypothetical protein [unclassified Guyparkeria]|uniref:hypothetical protein n=1 Tax=unclassified Guyparkeria TaxID=2626246 RepID=UPI0007334E27|nr:MULTISPECIES: hypothetical protein [unclassified Guyparkeria]KTG15949.1 hypothetical protein AUR63_05705 [Guyparkeria sp. XI15]OAE84704.1 hypothetical protein AWR35_05715 [Guyparkeria sp. WRN-7]
MTVPSPADTKATTKASEAFDWDAAWQEAEERAAEEQRLLEKARQVNEGDLVFLTAPPDPDAARMEKRILLDRHSLETGWAKMRQCHDNLDPAPAVQIVYNDERTRDIRITRRDGVGMARVDGPSVQMREIERGARICVSAEVLAIVPHPEADGYLVENGPFMRRFLDGYYPMRVQLRIDWPTGLLELAGSVPEAQPGLSIETDRGGVTLEAHFEGRLISRLHLTPGPAVSAAPR